jgi:hypothetical protein
MQKVAPIKLAAMIETDPNFHKLKNYLTPFNTFSGISNDIVCFSNKSIINGLAQQLKDKSYDANIPIYIFNFSNPEITRDIYSFIDFFLNFSKITAVEKEKTKKYLECIFSVFLNIGTPIPLPIFLTPTDLSGMVVEDTIYDSKMIDKLEDLEKLLYPKSFSYAASAREKYESRRTERDNRHTKDSLGNAFNDSKKNGDTKTANGKAKLPVDNLESEMLIEKTVEGNTEVEKEEDVEEEDGPIEEEPAEDSVHFFFLG